MDIASVNVATIASATNVAVTNTLGESVSSIIARELRYCKVQGKQVADGLFVGVLTYNTDWLRNIDERLAVEFTLSNALWNAGMRNEDGSSKMFAPITIPFHVNEQGEPLTQLRMFFYRKASSEQDKYPKATIIVRCEPFGTEVAFDRDSKYAQPAAETAVAEPVTA